MSYVGCVTRRFAKLTFSELQAIGEGIEIGRGTGTENEKGIGREIEKEIEKGTEIGIGTGKPREKEIGTGIENTGHTATRRICVHPT